MENIETCNKCGGTEFYTSKKKKCIQCNKQKCKDYKAKNTDHVKQYNKKYKKENRESIRVYERKIAEENIVHKVGKNLRCRIWNSIKANGSKKNEKTEKLTGTTKKELIEWLEFLIKKQGKENQFNMDNYGEVWHIDHVVPCSVFDLADPIEQYKCFNWTNLQPLYKTDNLSKNNNVDVFEILDQQDLVLEYSIFKNIDLDEYSITYFMDQKYVQNN